MKKITILGGGIGGLCTAIAFEKKGYAVTVLESASAFKPVGAGIALSPNALYAMQILGIKDRVMERALEYHSGSMLKVDGTPIVKMDMDKITEQTGGNFVTLHRHELHAVLASCLQSSEVKFGKRCSSIRQEDSQIVLSMEDGSEERADILIAADGIHSVVRKYYLPGSQERYSGQTCWRGVCPRGTIKVTGVSETWGKGIRFGIVPLREDRIYWFAVLDAPLGAVPATSKSELISLFSDFHAPVKSIIEQTPDIDIFQSDLNDLLPIRQFAFGNVLLLGDAAHATTPNMGQGACMAIEDAAMLHELMPSQETNFAELFQQLEQARIKRTTQIVNMSYRFGKLAQSKNSFLIWLRNNVMKYTPEALNLRMYRTIFGYKVA